MTARQAATNAERCLRLRIAQLPAHWLLLLILLLALALRLLLWSQPLHQLANDEVEYVTVARDLLAGRGWEFYNHYHWLRAPLYPLFLAASLWLVGGDLHLAALPNIALSVATVYLNYRLTRALLGQRAALLAALLTALLFTLATFASLYMAETLFTFLFTAALICLFEPASAAPNWRAALAAGVLLGFAMLTRSVPLGFLPVIVLWLWLARWPALNREKAQYLRDGWIKRVKAARDAVILLLAVAAVIAPWTIRNQIAYGQAILIETGLSYNMWAFNEPREDETTIFRTLENIGNPARRSEYATTQGLARLREDPWILARKLLPNWIYLWRVKPIEDRFLQASYYSDINLPVFASALVLDDALYLLIALAGVGGLLWWLRATWPARSSLGAVIADRNLVLALWVLYTIVTTLLTHGEARYRQLMYPALLPYAAGSLARLVQGHVRVRWPIVVLTALLWLMIAGTALFYYPWEWAGQNLARGWYAFNADLAWSLGARDRALQADERALAVHKTSDGWLRLGNHARAMGDSQSALNAYHKAVDLNPPYLAAVALYGDMLRELGDERAARKAFEGSHVDNQELTDWSWQALRPAPMAFIDVGNGTDYGYVVGMYPEERLQNAKARWTNGYALLRLQPKAQIAPATLLLQIRLAAPRPGLDRTSVQVCLAERCQTVQVGPTWRVYRLVFDITQLPVPALEVRGPPFSANNGRQLDVMIDWAKLDAIPAAE